jgi:predicted nucleotidyltransferase
MALPEFDSQGDLPDGLHRATLAEVLARFGEGSSARRNATASLKRIYERATATEKLDRFVIFGSYITSKQAPNDVDIVLVMKDDFSLGACDEESRPLFDHQRAQDEIGASIFWLCPSILLRGSLEEFLVGWGTKRDLTRRGIVEVVP